MPDCPLIEASPNHKIHELAAPLRLVTPDECPSVAHGEGIQFLDFQRREKLLDTFATIFG